MGGARDARAHRPPGRDLVSSIGEGQSSIGLPSAPITYHLPPEPWPVTSPGLASWMNVYRGQPPYVAWACPLSGRVAVPSFEASTPVPAVAGPASDGQAARHLSVQVLGPLLSGSKMYSVMPFESTRILPSEE